MKKFNFYSRLIPLQIFFLSLFFLWGCNVTHVKPSQGSYAVENTEPMADFDEAINEEMNLLKDPHTGKIPADVRELELKQANEILTKQLSAGSNLTSANTYSFQGPSNLGGRTRALAFDVADGTGNTMIAGSVSGGVFRTTNGGTSWTRVSTNAQQYTITAIAQDTRAGQRNNWYYATGEGVGNSAAENGAFYTADGIYKSTDNGLTWTRLAASNTGSLFAFDNCNDLITLMEMCMHVLLVKSYVLQMVAQPGEWYLGRDAVSAARSLILYVPQPGGFMLHWQEMLPHPMTGYGHPPQVLQPPGHILQEQDRYPTMQTGMQMQHTEG
jgi:hypothetical protein